MRSIGVTALWGPVVRACALVVVVLLGASGLALLSAAPAQAASRLSVSSSLGGDAASSTGPTTFTVSGSGFQAIEGGFGGVYVGFGWVNGSGWGPSKGGSTGGTYDYVPDEQSRDNQGYQKFVAFPGSSTSGEAQATMSSDGSFRTTLTVPGPTFTGAGGKRIDCLTMTCGFFTWGAHGVRNGANETFTPVTFQAGAAPAAGASTPTTAADAAASAQSGRAGGNGRVAAGQREVAAARAQPGRAQAAQQSGGSASAGENSAGAPAPAGDSTAADQPVDALDRLTVGTAAVVEVDRRAARAGGAMGFAAAGFWPGEQVYVVLGDGDAAVGPVIAGVDGEVAGVIMLPQNIESGTHEIRAAGAGSGLEAAERFPVRADIANAAASSTGFVGSLKWIFLALSALVLLAMAAVVVKRRQAAAAEAAGQGDDDGDDDFEGGDHIERGDHFSSPTGLRAGPGIGEAADEGYASAATPFPHPAMAGGAVSTTTTAFEKKDLR